jgi:cell division transport system permease protein
MQLVGAKSGFIINPFIKRAGFQGLLAGIIASGLLYALLSYANRVIEELQRLQRLEDLLLLFGSLMFLGIFIGVLSTYKAVKKYLKMSLDELY